MSFLKRIFAFPTTARDAHSQPASQWSGPASTPQPLGPQAQQTAGRREMLRLVLRDTLNRSGIPTAWVGADMLAATSRGREPGLHVRFLLKHWDPRLMLHGVAFQNAFKKRVLTLDPEAEQWLLGFSWQFSLANDHSCPQLPHPGVWTSSVPGATPAAIGMEATLTEVDNPDLLGGSIVISGPAATPDPTAARPAAAATTAGAARARAQAKADLERLFAVRDADVQRHSNTNDTKPPAFASTQPAGLVEVPDAEAVQASFAKTDVFRRPQPQSH